MTSRREAWIGKRVERLEDPPLVRGAGRFVADISFPHQLHMRVARSDRAHADLLAVDAEQARAAPGVAAVWTAEDVADIGPIVFRATEVKGLEPYRQHILARGRVRYVGEPVAAVFADSPYRAEDAAELVSAFVPRPAADPLGRRRTRQFRRGAFDRSACAGEVPRGHRRGVRRCP